MIKLKNEKGVTVLMLVVTIIVSLIISATVIGTIRKNNMIDQAEETRNEIEEFQNTSDKTINDMYKFITGEPNN